MNSNITNFTYLANITFFINNFYRITRCRFSH